MAKSKKIKVSKEKLKHKLLKWLLASIFILAISVTITVFLYYSLRALPSVSVAGTHVGGLTKNAISDTLKSKFPTPDKISIRVRDVETDINLSNINFAYNFEKTADSAILFGKIPMNFPTFKNIPVNLFKTADIPLTLSFDQNKLDEYLKVLASEYAKPATAYSVTLKSNEVVIDKGLEGEVANIDLLKSEILKSLTDYNLGVLELNFTLLDETLNDEEVVALTHRAQSLIGKNIILEHDYYTFTLTDKELIAFLAKGGGYNKDSIAKHLADKVAPTIERDPQNATFVFNDQHVEEFSPAKAGISLNMDDSINTITNEISKLENDNTKSTKIVIQVTTKSPDITLEEVNNLGIQELVGRGVSYYKGSIPSRIFNVGHAAAKFKSVLVAPGEEFSFNKILGDVSALTGYKQAYIIKDGRTVLGDGGGVCQVSTTLFRAVLNAGLPIIERRAHSYRVGYYEQGSPAGLDATVFYPTTDFKFKNDTPGHILIQSTYDPKNYTLVFEIYGTKDGRVATVSKPVTSGVVPPPEDLYVDDPTLPTGQIKQIDHKAWGAKISFNYKVERDGDVLIDKTFISNYRPWQSVFLRGTGPTN